MAGENTSGRSWFRRAGSELIDRMFLGNRAHDYTSGNWNKDGAIQGGSAALLNMFLPGGGTAANLWFNSRQRQGYDGLPSWLGGLDPIQQYPSYAAGIGRGIAGFVPSSGPTGVAPSAPTGLAGLAGLGAASGLPGMVPQQPPGDKLPLDPVTLQPVDRVRNTISTMPRPSLAINTGPAALSHMGGARSAFNHGGTVLEGEAARNWMEAQKYQRDPVNFRYGQGDLMS